MYKTKMNKPCINFYNLWLTATLIATVINHSHKDAWNVISSQLGIDLVGWIGWIASHYDLCRFIIYSH